MSAITTNDPAVSAISWLFGSRAYGEDAKLVKQQLCEIEREDRSEIGEKKREVLHALEDEFRRACSMNWDGYGALPADPFSYNYAGEFLRLLPSHVPNPEISVDPDGEISMEWDCGPRNVFSVSVGRDGTLTYAGLFGYNKAHGTEIYSGHIPANISTNLNRVLK